MASHNTSSESTGSSCFAVHWEQLSKMAGHCYKRHGTRTWVDLLIQELHRKTGNRSTGTSVCTIALPITSTETAPFTGMHNRCSQTMAGRCSITFGPKVNGHSRLDSRFGARQNGRMLQSLLFQFPSTRIHQLRGKNGVSPRATGWAKRARSPSRAARLKFIAPEFVAL